LDAVGPRRVPIGCCRLAASASQTTHTATQTTRSSMTRGISMVSNPPTSTAVRQWTCHWARFSRRRNGFSQLRTPSGTRCCAGRTSVSGMTSVCSGRSSGLVILWRCCWKQGRVQPSTTSYQQRYYHEHNKNINLKKTNCICPYEQKNFSSNNSTRNYSRSLKLLFSVSTEINDYLVNENSVYKNDALKFSRHFLGANSETSG